MALTADYAIGTFTFPRGWFMVAESSEVTQKPLAVRYFGQDLALFRGHSGRVILLDAYCPHMGTHFVKNATSYVIHDGQVEGDSLRCPYHAWRFGPDGKCNHIPNHTGSIPTAARVRSWPLIEAFGAVFVWHDPEGGDPEWAAPSLPEYGQPGWVPWTFDHLGTLACHPQEVIDNIADYAHLGPVHGSTVEWYRNEFHGHRAVQYQGGGHRTLVSTGGAAPTLSTDTTYHGPGFLLSYMSGFYESIIYIAHTPVDDGLIKVWHGLLVKCAQDVPTAEDITNARSYQEMSRLAFAQDFDVWANKRPAQTILQTSADGPFHKARIWYKQFYNPRAQREQFRKQVEGTVYQVPSVPPHRPTACLGRTPDGT